ncbi:Ribosomal protein L13 domain [Phytophthora cactorum]|nr:Ribosomal protein L13 domain [Phytophthora cactorum]
MVFEKPIVVDCRGHLVGRLASLIAKELLQGQHVVAVRCEQLEISGSQTDRSSIQLQSHTRPAFCCLWASTCATKSSSSILEQAYGHQPQEGPHPLPCPRACCGARSVACCRTRRPVTFDGIPSPYDKQKRMVIPAALRVLRLKANRRYTVLGDLASEVGWRHSELVKRLEQASAQVGRLLQEEGRPEEASCRGRGQGARRQLGAQAHACQVGHAL